MGKLRTVKVPAVEPQSPVGYENEFKIVSPDNAASIVENAPLSPYERILDRRFELVINQLKPPTPEEIIKTFGTGESGLLNADGTDVKERYKQQNFIYATGVKEARKELLADILSKKGKKYQSIRDEMAVSTEAPAISNKQKEDLRFADFQPDVKDPVAKKLIKDIGKQIAIESSAQRGWGLDNAGFAGLAMNRSMINSWYKLFTGENLSESPVNKIRFTDNGVYYDGEKLDTSKLSKAENAIIGSYIQRKSNLSDNPTFLEETALTFASLTFDLPLIVAGGQASGAILSRLPIVGNILKASSIAGKPFGRLWGNIIQNVSTFQTIGIPGIITSDDPFKEMYHNAQMGLLASAGGWLGSYTGKGIAKIPGLGASLRRHPGLREEVGGLFGSFGFGFGSTKLSGGSTEDALSSGLAFAATHFTNPSSLRRAFGNMKENRVMQLRPSKEELATGEYKNAEYYLESKDGNLSHLDRDAWINKGEIIETGSQIQRTNEHIYVHESPSKISLSFAEAFHVAKVEEVAQRNYKWLRKELGREYTKENDTEVRETARQLAITMIQEKATRGVVRNLPPKDVELNKKIHELINETDLTYNQIDLFIRENVLDFIKDPNTYKSVGNQKFAEALDILKGNWEQAITTGLNRLDMELMEKKLKAQTKILDTEGVTKITPEGSYEVEGKTYNQTKDMPVDQLKKAGTTDKTPQPLDKQADIKEKKVKDIKKPETSGTSGKERVQAGLDKEAKVEERKVGLDEKTVTADYTSTAKDVKLRSSEEILREMVEEGRVKRIENMQEEIQKAIRREKARMNKELEKPEEIKSEEKIETETKKEEVKSEPEVIGKLPTVEEANKNGYSIKTAYEDTKTGKKYINEGVHGTSDAVEKALGLTNEQFIAKLESGEIKSGFINRKGEFITSAKKVFEREAEFAKEELAKSEFAEKTEPVKPKLSDQDTHRFKKKTKKMIEKESKLTQEERDFIKKVDNEGIASISHQLREQQITLAEAKEAYARHQETSQKVDDIKEAIRRIDKQLEELERMPKGEESEVNKQTMLEIQKEYKAEWDKLRKQEGEQLAKEFMEEVKAERIKKDINKQIDEGKPKEQPKPKSESKRNPKTADLIKEQPKQEKRGATDFEPPNLTDPDPEPPNLNDFNAGLIPAFRLKDIPSNIKENNEVFKNVTKVGFNWLAKGFKTFKDWSGQMIKDLGNGVKNILRRVWAKVKPYATGEKAILDPNALFNVGSFEFAQSLKKNRSETKEETQKITGENQSFKERPKEIKDAVSKMSNLVGRKSFKKKRNNKYITEDAQNFVKVIKDYIKKGAGKINERIKEIEKQIENGADPSKPGKYTTKKGLEKLKGVSLATELDVLRTFGNIKKKTNQEILDAQKRLEQYIDGDLNKRKAQIELEKKEEKEDVGLLTESAGGIVSQQDFRARELEEGVINRNPARNLVTKFLQLNLTGGALFDYLDRTAHKPFQGKLYDKFFRPIKEGRRKYNENVLAYNKKVEGLKAKIWGLDIYNTDMATKIKNVNKLKRLENQLKQKVKTGIKLLNGKELIMSKLEAARHYQLLKDPALRATFVENQWNVKTAMKELENFMGKELTEYSNEAQKLFTEMYPSVNKVFQKVYNSTLPFNPFYSGKINRMVESVKEDANLLNQFEKQFVTMYKQQFTERVNSTADIRFEDFDVVLTKHITDMEHFKAFAETAKRLQNVFGSLEAKTAIEQNFGAKMNKTVQDYIDDLIAGHTRRKQHIAALDTLRSNFTKAVIGGNPVVFAKQLTSIPAYAFDIPVKEFISGFGDFMSNPMKAYKTLMESPVMQARASIGFERDFMNTISRVKPSGTRDFNSLTNMLLFTTKLGDRAAIIIGGWSNYRYHLNKFTKEGMGKERAHQKALREFELATERSQQAGNIEDLPALMRTGSIGKLFTMFMTAPNQYFNQVSAGIRALYRNQVVTNKLEKIAKETGDYSAYEKAKAELVTTRVDAAKRIAIGHILLPMLFQFVASGFKWDEKRLLRAGVVGSLNGMLILGDWLEAGFEAWNNDWDYKPELVPLATSLTDLYKGVGKASDVKEKFATGEGVTMDDIFDTLEPLGRGTSLLVGLPTATVTRIIEGNVDYWSGSYDNLLNTMGWSKWALEGSRLTKKELDVIRRNAMESGDYEEYLTAYEIYKRQQKLRKGEL
jgi:hypothetical protein